MSLKDLILDMSRQARIAPLTPWFDHELDRQIQLGYFLGENQLEQLAEDLINKLRQYSTINRINTVVLGMSGGVDSALTAALFKRAGWIVIGVTMPIHQDEAETQRGVEACEALGVNRIHKDLSALYDATLDEFANVDPALNGKTPMMAANEAALTAIKIRRGNVRARLRMITLYNLAAMHGGLVASTDNFSELAAGFWTLHGDVGDLAPIQSLLKSWEVPMLAKIVGVPESTWRATPTDGLGISAGDEAQLGGTYLEWDLMVRAMHSTAWLLDGDDNTKSGFADVRANTVFDAVVNRMRRTHFKRNNPACLDHSTEDRYEILRTLDVALAR